MAGRLFGSLVVAPWRVRRAMAPRKAAAPGKATALKTIAVPLAAGFVVAYPLIVVWITGLAGAVKWVDNFGIQILIYVMLGLGLNIVVGLAGLLDLGYVAFYAVGAYSYALLSQTFGLSFFMLLPLAGIFLTYCTVYIGMQSFAAFDRLFRQDLSYGIYLYGFPITQATMSCGLSNAAP